MIKTRNRAVALLLACLQIVLLLVTVMPQAKAEGESAEAPKLNRTYTGNMQFGSFNFASGYNYTYTTTSGFIITTTTTHLDKHLEGADYIKPFIFTDDYFAAPAYSEALAQKVAASGKTLNWLDIENHSLATASMDFAMASFGSAEEAVDDNGNVDYARHSKNAEAYLAKCGFPTDRIVVNTDAANDNAFNTMPRTDTVGVVIGSKDITVWTGRENENFTLVAIGVRGAGYGAEWASNLTLGDGVENREHDGFRASANKVEETLDRYLSQQGINNLDNVKFWVCGYSRGGAIANLVAGDLSSKAKYGADRKNVYGYTFEAAAAAPYGTDPDGSNYPNIHNIVNKMDAVPRVSSRELDNIRLGVDYLTPYYKNALQYDGQNDAYYKRMYSILRTIAVGYGAVGDDDTNDRNKKTDRAWVTDPVITNADPSSYPYANKVRTYSFAWGQFRNGFTEEFNPDTYPKAAEIGDSSHMIMLDDFLDQFVKVFFESKAWDYNSETPSAEFNNTIVEQQPTAMTHREKYVVNGYQAALRDLIGLALGTPGARLGDMVNEMKEVLTSDLLSSGMALLNLSSDSRSYTNNPSESRVNTVNSEIQSMLSDALHGTGMYKNGSQADKTKIDNAITTICPLFTRLYLYDRLHYGSQYFGTLLKYLRSGILVAHTPEQIVSWQMAMDDNYTSDYRRITLPTTTDVKMLVFRPGFEGALPEEVSAAAAATGAQIARFVNGEPVPDSVIDQRIEVVEKDDAAGTFTIRYPGTLDIRFDVKALSNFRSSGASVSDWAPIKDANNAASANVKTTFDRQDNETILPGSDVRRDNTEQSDSVSAVTSNSFLADTNFDLKVGETLQILAWHGSNSLDLNAAKEARYDVGKTAVKVVDYGSKTVVATEVGKKGESTTFGGTFDVDYEQHTLTFAPNTENNNYAEFSGLCTAEYSFTTDAETMRGKVDVVPATNVYYEDSVELVSEKQEDGTITSDSCTIRFYGTGIDAYCTCDASAGWVRADLYSSEDLENPVDYKIVGNNYKNGALYNVPSIHFDCEEAGDYTLILTASYGKNYKLDGVRVYNESHADPVESKLAMVDEGEASYVNVRDLVLKAENVPTDVSADVQGAVFFTGDPGHKTISDYETIGPKRELYLMETGQGVAFSVSQPGSVKVEIGLRSANGNSGVVKINGSRQDVTSVDSYYTVTPVDGNVIISFDDECSGQIAVTYIKLTAKTEPVVEEQTQIEPIGPQRIYASASLLSFVNEADPSAEPTPIPTPEPTADPISEVVNRLISEMVARLFQSISKLFGAR